MGTQPPGQGQRLAGEAAAGADVLSVPGPARLGTSVQQDVLGGAQCSQDSGMRLGGSADAATGTLGSVGQRQAGQAAPATTGHRGRHHPSLDPEQLQRARLQVERAIKEKKIFMVQGPYPIIRSLLRARGWVEKKSGGAGKAGSRPEWHHGSQETQLQEKAGDGDDAEQGEAALDPQLGSACCGAQPSQGTSEPLHSPSPPEEEEERWDEDPEAIHNLMSRLVRDQVPYFIWTNRCSAVDCWLLQQDQVVNHYARVGAFTTKEGLCQNLRNLPWFDQVDPDTFFPRCYRLRAADERQAFIEDFHLTAARSLLKVAAEGAMDVLAGMEQPPKCSEEPGPGPPLPPHLVEEALQVCGQHLSTLGHQDIDGDPPSPPTVGTDWNRFLQDYYRVVHEGAGLALSGAQREQCRALLQRLAGQLPQLGMEGDRNVWILKPGAKSRGRGKAGGSQEGEHVPCHGGVPPSPRVPCPGIVCAARLEEVLRLAGVCVAPSARVGEWVVQKYVERPLLIFGTKFDIRQWFLVTDWNPLTVWFYRESYLRFCSQPFSLHHLDPARHLCNVSIQKRYRLARGRHPQLPPDQTWSCRQLQAYLAQVGLGGAWHQVMVPGMKAAVVGALRSAQDLVEHRKGSFELYGADFIFGEDCQPWLLEINASPTMAPSSAVTRRLCASVQRDTLRVVIDCRDNPACPTGAFELIYKEVGWGGCGVGTTPSAPPAPTPHHVPLQAAVPVPPYVGLKLMVQGHSLKKPKLARHRSQGKPPTTAPCAPQPLVPPSPSGKTTKVPHRGAAPGEAAPLGRWSHRFPPASAPPAPSQPPRCCARSRGLPSIRRSLQHPPAALPWLDVRSLPTVPIPPPRGVPGSPWGPVGRPPPNPPVGVLHPPGLAPNVWPLCPCPGQPGPAARRRHAAGPKGRQKSCDTEGHPGGNSTLPVPAGVTGWSSAPPCPSWSPLPGGGTHPTPRRGRKTRL
ncbi:tubulin monoglycylase TTLL3 isoform X2 [Chroicocephalus ridibundus]|uniref:tubulin monoglycylase TTLL3 isoform X2 n=1 Tax=Chroicocephalus ridibundus TaxID=1192867 RepID=UPI002FDDF007